MSKDETKKKSSLYDQLIKAGEAALDAASNVLNKRADKRAFDSAYDSLLAQKDKISKSKLEFYGKKGKYADYLDEHLKTAWKSRDIDDSIDMLKEEYKHIFGIEYKPRD